MPRMQSSMLREIAEKTSYRPIPASKAYSSAACQTSRKTKDILMLNPRRYAHGIRTFVVAGLVLASPVLLAHPHGPPPGAGNPHSQQHKEEHGPNASARVPIHFFTDQKSEKVKAYYAHRFHEGHCPPGLARKHNGCMPPGQTRQWHVGQPLPVSATIYPVPPVVIRILGTPPTGYRYVRVADDILLMANGTRMVVDAIQNLGR